MTTVEWVLDSDGRFEVSSVAHLVQLMNKGALYTDAGAPPSNYWASSYIQTADLDLIDDHVNVVCIGNDDEKFTGEYDGNFHKVSNWSHAHVTVTTVGLFGSTKDCILKHMRLTGVWTIAGFTAYGGFLIGTSSSGAVFDIESDFSVGTVLGAGSPGSTAGVLFGYTTGTNFDGITMGGVVDIATTPENQSNIWTSVGGVFGLVHYGKLNFVRNTARFPSGIRANVAGGIGAGSYAFDQLTNLVNAMEGDITGSNIIGGIWGNMRWGTPAEETMHSVINCMTGDLTSGDKVGGVFGSTWAFSSCTIGGFANCMVGNITSAHSQSLAGGIFGSVTDNNYDYIMGVVDCAVAMSGHVHNAVCTDVIINRTFQPGPPVECIVDTSSGMTYAQNNFGTVGDLGGFGFPDLPFVSMIGTDYHGNSYSWEFGATPPAMELKPGPINIRVDIGVVSGATGYHLSYQSPTGEETTAHSSFIELRKNIGSLVPETTYTIRLYADTESGHALVDTQTIATTANSVENYEVADFVENGKFKLGKADGAISGVMNDLFNTGDRLQISIGNKKDLDVGFVNVGGNARIGESDALLIPFSEGSGAEQAFGLTLGDETTVAVTYDDASNAIVVGSSVYTPGDTFVLDDKKVSVLEY